MNKEEILEELRTKRESLQEQAPQNVVIQNIKLLGEVELVKKQSENDVEQDSKKVGKLYLIEEYNTETDEIMIKYYLDDEFVGISNEGDFLPTGLARESYENVDSIKDIVEDIKPQEEQKRVEDRKIYDLKQLEDEEELEDDSKGKSEKKEEIIKDKKISNIKGEVDLDQQVNGETLRKILDLGEEYDSIAPVRAASIGVPSNSEYVFVAIKTDKTCMVLGEDIIKEDRQKGTNPEEKDLMINNDGSLTEESSLYNFRILNRPNLVMTGRRDKNSSTIATTISDVSGRESRDEEVAQELHKDGDRRIDDDARNLLREENGIEASDNLSKKQEGHEAAGCENDRVENIDEDTSNDIPHINPDDLIPDTEITWRKFAEMCGYRGKDGVEKAHKEFIKHKSDNPDLSNEELIDTKVEELEQEMPSSRKR